jgi:hypothetical protein
MRNLLLILIAFLAVVTFIRAFEKMEPEPNLPQQAAIEINAPVEKALQ